jgi:hypothetical protein
VRLRGGALYATDPNSNDLFYFIILSLVDLQQHQNEGQLEVVVEAKSSTLISILFPFSCDNINIFSLVNSV